jgi:hypothetical protein
MMNFKSKIFLIQTGVFFVNFELFLFDFIDHGGCRLDLLLKITIVCLEVLDLGLFLVANVLSNFNVLFDSKIMISDMLFNERFFFEEC